uniref:hypothetical protein n=1 Tax=Methylobacterium sp. B34 TaxID=95563 RepID=UPI00034B4FD0|nr:hypothetical protein [Methylobacterium sp. B34]
MHRGGTGRMPASDEMMQAMMTPADLPIWAMLTPPSLDALLLGRGQTVPRAITLASDLDSSSVADAPLLTTTRLMIQRAQAIDGLTLTATGALSRADVRAIFDAMSWPGYDKVNALAMNKVLNEADVMPVELTRLTAQTAKLLRQRDKRLLTSKVSGALAEPEAAPELFARLFATIFWQTNLSYFDRVPFEAWPQNHIGIVLWCLSVAGEGWFLPEDLMRSCTVWEPALIEGHADFPAYAFESRVLRPLSWFGLLEMRMIGDLDAPTWQRDRQYRKATLFDLALRFDVKVARPPGPAH